MKKYVHIMLVLLMVAGFFFTGAAKPVSAIRLADDSGVAAGSWVWTSASVPGAEIAMDKLPKSPYSWLQLLTNGLKIDGAAKICHPFKGGQFGWTGEIRQLVNGQWVKLVTTNAWVPSTEGTFMSCAQVSAGTYALFGYYTKPKVVEMPECTNFFILPQWEDNGDGLVSNIFAVVFPTPPVNTLVTYSIFNVDPPGLLQGALTGSAHTDGDGIAYFPGNITYDGSWTWTATVRVEAMGCYLQFTVDNTNYN